MGLRGTGRQDLRVLELRGTAKAARKKERALPGATLQPPTWLSASAKAEFQTLAPVLARHGLSTEVDSIGLSVLCSLYAEYIKLSALLDAAGPTVADQGTDRSSPLYRLWLQVGDQLAKWCQQFGMTPRSRQGLTVQVPEPEDAKSRFFRD